MQMLNKKDVNFAELETMRTSRSPTTVMTANGVVQTREEATENVKQLDSFVKAVFLEETPAVLSLENLCEDHGKTKHNIGSAIRNHISSEIAKELIAIYQIVFHSLFLVYLRVPPQRPHLLLQHLHRRIL